MTRLGSTDTRRILLVGRFGILLLAGLFVVTACRVLYGQAKPAAWKVLETSYLPSDTSLAILVRPAELAAEKLSQPVVDAVDALLRPAKLGISVADIDEFKFAFVGTPDRMGGQPEYYLVTRAKRAVDWKKVFGVTAGKFKEKEVNGQKLYLRGSEAFWLPDERTIVVGMREAVERNTGNPDPNDRADWWDHWQKAAKSPLAGFMHANILGVMSLPGPDGKPDKSFASLGKDAKFAVLEGNVTDKGFAIQATILANSNEGAVTIAPVVARALTNFASMIVSETRLTGQDGERLVAQLTSLLGSTQIVTQGKTLEIKALVTPKMLEVFAESAQLIGAR